MPQPPSRPRLLVNVFHPDLATSRVNRAWAEAAAQAGHEVRDVNQLNPNFQIDVPAEQAALEQADIVVLQHPMHWYSGPAILKHWIDQVLTYNWAYGDRYALAGKTWLSAVSIGGHAEEYTHTGNRAHTAEEFLVPYARTAAFVQMHFHPPFLTYAAGYLSPTELTTSAQTYQTLLHHLTTPP